MDLKLHHFYTLICGWITGTVYFFVPLKFAFAALICVVIVDLLTGIWASRIRKISISSRRLRMSIRKMLGYFEIILLLFIIEKGFDFEVGSYRFVGGFICFVEFISIMENTAIISGNNIFLSIIKLIRGKAESTYGEVIDEIIKEKNE